MKKIDIIRKYPTPVNFGECAVCQASEVCGHIRPGFHKPAECPGPEDVLQTSSIDKCEKCGYTNICDHIRCTGFVTFEYALEKAATAARIVTEQSKAQEKKYERTFVPKSHNAVKISEHMARRFFADGVRIIVRPSGRNTLERGAVYKLGESLVWKDKKTAHIFEDIINDFKIGFGRADGNDTFRYYLYMD